MSDPSDVIAEMRAYIADHPALMREAAAERAAALAEGERLYHVVVIRVHLKTGERVDPREWCLTSYPMRHAHCMVLASKWTPRRFQHYATTWALKHVHESEASDV